jgi:hypothetical protein
MKKLAAVFLCLICLTSYAGIADEYDIVYFYKAITPADGTKVVDSLGGLNDAQLILVPVVINAGDYAVTVTRKGSNLYKVDGKDLYIETKFCYQYSFSQKVVLKVESSYGLRKGVVIFKSPLDD